MSEIYMERLPKTEISLESTVVFINKIRSIERGKGQKIVCFDIANLYPPIERKKNKQTVNNEIEKKYTDPKIDQEFLARTKNLITEGCHFKFNYQVYTGPDQA